MALRKIREIGDPCLNKKCRDVEVFDSKLHALLDDMKETMQLANGEDKEKVIAQWSDLAQPIVRNAVKDLVVKSKKKGLFF